jgi:hypothetical protein
MPNSAAVAKDWFDIVIVVPLEEELISLMEVFPPSVNRSTDRAFRHEIDAGQKGLRVLVVQQEGMGRTHAARAVSETLLEFDVGLVVLRHFYAAHSLLILWKGSIGIIGEKRIALRCSTQRKNV